MFTNRKEAAHILGKKLSHLSNESVVVLGIPRGGVILGKYIAKQLSAPFDLVMTKKIGHPENAELAIGAVSMDDEVSISNLNIPEKYFNQKAEETRKLLRERYEKYAGNKARISLRNATAILVDDGIATGSTMLATIKLVRKQKPKKIIVAVPLAPQHAILEFEHEVDELIVLESPENFSAIGQFYEEFHQIKDDEVISLLEA